MTSPVPSGRPRGPRGGGADTRGEILDAAAAVFAERGLASASVREIARTAHVDPALVRHYFGSKEELFIEAMRPLRGDDAHVAALLDAPRATLGEAVVRLVLALWEDPVSGARLRAVVASVAAADRVGGAFAQVMMRDVLVRLARTDRAEERAAACATQIAGLAMGRYLLRVPVLAEASHDRIAALYGPALQRYLDGDLDPAD